MLIDSDLLNKISEQAVVSPRLRMNFNLHKSESAPAQRLLNALEPGTVLPIHRHNHTDETYIDNITPNVPVISLTNVPGVSLTNEPGVSPTNVPQ